MNTMKKTAMAFFAVLVVGFALLANAPAASAKAAPDEALTGVNVSDASILGLASGKPLFLNFWATWCPPCVEEMPAIEAMYKKHGDRLNFAAVSVDNETGVVPAFISSRGLTLPVYIGSDLNKIANDYYLDAIPRSILVGADGSIIAEHAGGMTEAELEAFLSKAL